MKTRELRIGSFVTLSENQRQELFYNEVVAQNEYFKVDTIYSDDDIVLELDDENVDFNIIDVSPISLTEKWLLDFGFEKKCDYLYESEKFRIEPSVLDNAIWQFRFIISKNQSVWIASVIYIHQLQNLYFALTGEELTLKTKL